MSKQVHATFNASTAGSLRQALSMSGRDENVICLFENFSFGPIKGDNLRDRVRWVKKELRYPHWGAVTERAAAFLEESKGARAPVTAWVSWKESMSYAGFLWWLPHVPNISVSLIEIENLSTMEARELVKFIDKADTISRNMRVVYEDYWNKLRIEDAPLRIICGEDLISVPMTYFDDALLRLATREWQRMARIVAKVLDGYFSDGINQVSDIVLGARLAALAEAGKLEWKGDLSNMRQCELRLPLD